VRRALYRRFDQWVEGIDPDVRDAIGDPGGWLGVSVLVGVVLTVAGAVPHVRELFDLSVWPALLAYLPALALGVTTGVLQQRGVLGSRAFGLLAAIDSGLGQFFTWSLVALSRGPGAGLMVAFPAVLAAYHGHALRSQLQHPFIAVAGSFALAGAVWLNHDVAHLALYGVGGPLAIGGSLVLGRISYLQGVSAREKAALREALDAQLLRERTRLLEESSEALVKVLGSSHDAGNAVSSLTVSVERLSLLARRPMTDEVRAAIATQASEVSEALRGLRHVLRRSRDEVDGARHGRLSVDCVQLAKTVARDVGGRFSDTEIRVNTHGSEPLHAMVCDGETTLSRILTNLVTNAAEGDGQNAASHIEIRLGRDAMRRVVIHVVDDGPGLPAGHRDNPFATFRTSKRGGTGLGLYTARQLAESCGGHLRLETVTAGGVQATVELPGAEQAS